MRKYLFAFLAALTFAVVATVPPPGDVAGAAPAQPAPLSQLVAQVDIPYESFTLDNGLKVIVHTDRKAPIVGVTVYYRVGSKHEPRGKTGFAHLYEHLFFGGSENAPDFDVPLEAAGSTSTNGSTWYDRTNYVETVPKGALDLALFLESDRMGHLLGAVIQEKLDKQRGVVQNEKRQGDNEPYGLVRYALGEGLFPVGHPYRHATIGSMADLDAATLADVRQWFHDNYAPNNVVLVLAGDIDAATARPAVERWFGDIKPGPEVTQPEAEPVTLREPVAREMTDRVPTIRLMRAWSGPGLNHADAPALDAGLRVLGGLASSRLDNALVREEQLAVAVSAYAETHEQVGMLQAAMDVRPGVDRAAAEARFDELIRQFIAEGPTEDELRRAATQVVSQQIGALERVGGFYGKGAQLAEGELYSGDPAKYKADLAAIAALTPAQVKEAMQRWMTRPAFSLAIVPGERTEKGETMGGWGDEATRPPPRPDPKQPAPPLPPAPKRTAPPLAPVADLTFPTIERAQLANGIPVSLARRTAVPKVLVSINFDAGYAADAGAAPGTQSLMMGMLDEGTTTRTATEIAEEQERLGASLSTGASLDASTVTLDALTANLAPSLALMADVVRSPAFAPGEVERVKGQQLAALAQALASPRALATRMLPTVMFGPAHPYGLPADGLGTAEAISAQTPASLRGAHGRWLRPDLARITVVGDIEMERLLPLLDQAFGAWAAPAGPAPTKAIDAAVPAPRPRIVLVDRPNSPQSVIFGGKVLPLTGRDAGNEALDLANEVIGGGFLSRLNEQLREQKGWTYGVSSAVRAPAGPRSMVVLTPVQADRTADSIRLLIDEMKAFPATEGVDPVELQRVTEGNIRALPNRFETNSQVLGAIVANELLGRPDDYYATLPGKYRAIDAKALDAAARTWLQPDDLVFVVVGDRTVVEPQLAGLDMPVEVVDSAAPSD